MLKKLAAAVIAASTAIIPFSADTVNILSQTDVYAEEIAYTYSIPEWIPQSFEDAISFRNKYGTTHIGDAANESDLLCVVFQEEDHSKKKYDIKNTAGLVTVFYHEVFVDKDTDTAYEVMTYKNAATSKPDFKVQFSCDSELQKEYTFTSFGTQVVETDIYSWLPDCEKEYWDFAENNSHLSLKDNYVVFCLSHNAGTAYDWTQKDKGTECFKLETVSDCSPLSAVPLDGGDINTIYAYKAVKDGYDKISYEFGAVYADSEELKKPLEADCAVINDAQNILLSGDMRVTLVDYDTGELLTLPEDAIPRIWTDLRQSPPDGEIICNMQPSGLINNPGTVRLGDLFDGYNFSFGLVGDNLPLGYSLPETEDKSAGYHNGTIVPDDHMAVKKYDNGTADVVFRLKKNKSSEKSTTITFYDADTGELIDIPNGSIHLCKYTKQEPYISEKFDITSNPCTVDSSQVYEQLCGYYFTPETRSGW